MKIGSDLIALHLAVLLLGMTGLFAKFIPLSPAAIICGRTCFAAIFLAAYLFTSRRKIRLGNRSALSFAASGFLLSAHWYCFFYAIQSSTVAVGVIGFATFPIFVTFLEPLFFREKLRLLDIVSAVIVVLGLAVTVPDFDFSSEHSVALLWAVLSGLLLALYTLLNRHLIRNNDYILVTCAQCCVACLLTVPVVGFLTVWPTMNDFVLLVVLGVLFTAVPQALLVRGLKTISAQTTSVLVGLEPIYAIVFAVIFLQEVPSLLTLTGGLIVVSGVALAMYSHRMTTVVQPSKEPYS